MALVPVSRPSTLDAVPWARTVPAAAYAPSTVAVVPQRRFLPVRRPLVTEGVFRPGRAEFPQPPASLLDGFPDPASVEEQKLRYERDLDEQLVSCKELLAQRHQATLQFLRVKNEQQKRHAHALIDQQLMQSEADLETKLREQILALSQAAMARKFALERQAGALAMEYNVRRLHEEVAANDYAIQRRCLEEPPPPLPRVGQPGAPTAGLAGVLYLIVHACHDLQNHDTGILGDVSDPFVVARVGETEHRTPTINNNLNPVWTRDNRFTFPLDRVRAELHLEVMNANFFKHDSLGRLSVPLGGLLPDQWQRRRERLQDTVSGDIEFDLYVTSRR